MQRSITYKSPLTPFLYVIAFIAYESLSSIYLFLPPMFGVLLLLFIDTLNKNNTLGVLLVSISMIVFEAQMGYPLFSSIIYFSFVYKFIVPRLKKNFACVSCINISLVLLAYVGYYFFITLLSVVFLFPAPSMDFYLILYIFIEFLIVSIL